jgi:hypothetical protein
MGFELRISLCHYFYKDGPRGKFKRMFRSNSRRHSSYVFRESLKSALNLFFLEIGVAASLVSIVEFAAIVSAVAQSSTCSLCCFQRLYEKTIKYMRRR